MTGYPTNQSFLSRVKEFFWHNIGAFDCANMASADFPAAFCGDPSGDFGKRMGDAFGELVS